MSSFEAARLEKEWIATLPQTEFRLPIYFAAPTQRLFAAPKPGEAAGNGRHISAGSGRGQFDCVTHRRLTCLTRLRAPSAAFGPCCGSSLHELITIF
jgi:hypothetical protein